jgi:bifunctional non-homologous end joining protein LigD
VRDEAAKLGLDAFVKTSGGRGLHVLVPFQATWDVCDAFGRRVAAALERAHPRLVTTQATKTLRRGRVYLDALRNVRGATAVAPYSLRARDGALVSMPLTWEALRKTDGPERFDLRTVPALLTRRKVDPWAGFAAAASTPLPPAVRRQLAP